MFIMNKLLLKLFCYCVQILFFINVTTTCYLFGIWFYFFVCVVFFLILFGTLTKKVKQAMQYVQYYYRYIL